MEQKKRSLFYNIGVLWIKESSAGNHYLSGEFMLNGICYKICVFENQYKKNKSHPDYNIVLNTFNPMAGGRKPKEKTAKLI